MKRHYGTRGTACKGQAQRHEASVDNGRGDIVPTSPVLMLLRPGRIFVHLSSSSIDYALLHLPRVRVSGSRQSRLRRDARCMMCRSLHDHAWRGIADERPRPERIPHRDSHFRHFKGRYLLTFMPISNSSDPRRGYCVVGQKANQKC